MKYRLSGRRAVVTACREWRKERTIGLMGKPALVRVPSGVVEYSLAFVTDLGNGHLAINYMKNGKVYTDKVPVGCVVNIQYLN